MNFKNKTIGVWGLGHVGASVIRFLQRQDCTIIAMDKRELTATEHEQLLFQNIRFFPQTQIDTFFTTADYVIPSPGINLRLYPMHLSKCISELDLFYTNWHQPSIVITGTIGKTTVTHTIAQLLRNYGFTIVAGGNIGTTGMECLLDIASTQRQTDYAVLELSSFQLERSNITPDIAIITNIYDNHLDYHGSYDAYLQAKWRCITQQRDGQHAIIPLELLEMAHATNPGKPYVFCSSAMPTVKEIARLNSHDIIYYFNSNKNIIRLNNNQQTLLLTFDQLPQHSYTANWLSMVAVLDTLQLPIAALATRAAAIAVPEHRLQCVATIDGVHFYNDSKATIPQATLAAVDKIGSSSIILLWGGVSKGVDRIPYIKQLASRVKYIICFGKEAAQLYQGCLDNRIPAIAVATLQEAVTHAVGQAKPGDHILFSPAGASYDLFQDYEKRGEAFLQLVANLTSCFK